jgi:hypothetical protein
MKGNFHVPFLGGLGAVMPPGYPTLYAKEEFRKLSPDLCVKGSTKTSLMWISCWDKIAWQALN